MLIDSLKQRKILEKKALEYQGPSCPECHTFIMEIRPDTIDAPNKILYCLNCNHEEKFAKAFVDVIASDNPYQKKKYKISIKKQAKITVGGHLAKDKPIYDGF